MFDTVVQDIGPVLPQDVAWAQQSNHEKEAQLPHVKDGGCREGAREEIYCWSYSTGANL